MNKLASLDGEDHFRLWSKQTWVMPLGGFTLAMLAFVVTLLHVPWRDSGVYLYMAQQWLRGSIPYVDVWDHKPPLIYWIDAVGLVLGTGSYYGVIAVEAALFAVAIVLAFRTLERLLDRTSAYVGTAALCVGVLQTVDGGNLAPEFALVPQLLATSIVFSRPFQDLHGRQLMVVGLLGSAALMLKPNLIGVWLALNAVLSVACSPRCAIRHILWQSCGCIAGMVLFTSPIWLHGGLVAMKEAVLDYNLHYSATNGLTHRISAATSAFWFLPLFAIASGLGIGVVAYAWVFRRDMKQRNPRLLSFVLFAALLLPIELALATTSGRSYAHYFFPLAVPIAFTFALAVHLLQDETLSRNSFVRFLNAGLALGIVLSGIPSVNRYIWTLFKSSPQAEAAAYIREHTRPEDRVLIWGAETTINFLAGRAAPTPLAYQYPFVTPGVASQSLVAKFLVDLALRPPAFVVDTFNPSLPPINPALRDAWQPSTQERYGPPPENLQAFFAMVAKDYAMVSKVAGYEMYRRKDQR